MAEISFKEEVGGPPDLEATAVSRAEVSQRRRIADSDLFALVVVRPFCSRTAPRNVRSDESRRRSRRGDHRHL